MALELQWACNVDRSDYDPVWEVRGADPGCEAEMEATNRSGPIIWCPASITLRDHGWEGARGGCRRERGHDGVHVCGSWAEQLVRDRHVKRPVFARWTDAD